MRSLDGKVALVTGGGSGIGNAVARLFAGAGAGVTVVDVDERSGKAAAESVGGTFVRADVSDPEEIAAAVAQTVRAHGRLDIVHLNAGIATGERDLTSLTPEQYRRAVGVNVDGVVFGVIASVPAMAEGGAIVATASLAGLVPYPGDPIYGLTKHAVVGFVRAAADQLSARGVTINAVCPGFTDTPILGGAAEQFRAAGFPLLTAEEVAATVLEIASSGRTGGIYVCQPGRTLVEYEFRGVPGPRTPNATGMAPPGI